MHPAIPHLLELQRMDQRIAALRAELEAFPKRIRDADQMLNSARAALAAAKAAHTEKVAARKRAELDAEEWRERARKFRAQSAARSEEHTSELQSRGHLVCRLLLEKK